MFDRSQDTVEARLTDYRNFNCLLSIEAKELRLSIRCLKK